MPTGAPKYSLASPGFDVKRYGPEQFGEKSVIYPDGRGVGQAGLHSRSSWPMIVLLRAPTVPIGTLNRVAGSYVTSFRPLHETHQGTIPYCDCPH